MKVSLTFSAVHSVAMVIDCWEESGEEAFKVAEDEHERGRREVPGGAGRRGSF
jgi:hypothetical protein